MGLATKGQIGQPNNWSQSRKGTHDGDARLSSALVVSKRHINHQRTTALTRQRNENSGERNDTAQLAVFYWPLLRLHGRGLQLMT